MVELLAEQPGMSLRDIEQMAHHVTLVLAHAPDERFENCQRTRMQATLSLFALRLLARDVYDRFVAGACDGVAAAEGLKDALSDPSTAGSRLVASRMLMMLCHLNRRPPAERNREQLEIRLKESAIYGVVAPQDDLKEFHQIGQDIFGLITLEELSDLVELAA